MNKRPINLADHHGYLETNNKGYTHMRVVLNNVRLAFPNLFEAKAINNGKPKFSAAFLMKPGHPAIKELEAAILQVAKEKWGAKADAVLKQSKAQAKYPLQDGAVKADYDGYEGNMFINSTSDGRPIVADENKGAVTAADNKIYAGCFVHASVDAWAQDNQYGKRVNFTLLAVKFYKDGDAFSGRPPVDESELDDLGSGFNAPANDEDDEELA